MAYVNVADWKTNQVCEWLKGLDSTVLPYVHSFGHHGVNGQQLLNLRPEDLEQLGVFKLGHQEIILEAVEYLRNFHYELDRENLQLLAMQLSCQAHSLHNELCQQTDSKPVTTQALSDVVAIITAVKPLVRWLDRSPFNGHLDYNDKKTELLKLSLEMATCAQRDRFADKPIEEIRSTCEQMAKLADYIIQDVADPMILQPASLDLATLKKKSGDDLGFCILPSFHGAHQIAEIKFGSAAHQCGKMEEGDEIVQVNYQTVVGWERKNVLELFRESPSEILLTLKRRPRHTKVYGQIYIKPYRLPSNKKTPYGSKWHHNLPSPRPELLTIPDFTMPLPKNVPKVPSPKPTSVIDTVDMLDTMTTDSSGSDSETEAPSSVRLYSSKPRTLVQRRATITGASPTAKHSIDIEQFWKLLKKEHSTTFQLRDKAASCAHMNSVQINTRPQTCLGIEQRALKGASSMGDGKKVKFQDVLAEIENEQKLEKLNAENIFATILNKQLDNKNSNTTSDKYVPLQTTNQDSSNNNVDCDSNLPRNAGSPSHVTKERGKLDKSQSVPAYDPSVTGEQIEDRKAVFDQLKFDAYLKNAKSTYNNNLNKTESSGQSEEKCLNKNIEVGLKSNKIGNVAKKINELEKMINTKNLDVNEEKNIKHAENYNKLNDKDAHNHSDNARPFEGLSSDENSEEEGSRENEERQENNFSNSSTSQTIEASGVKNINNNFFESNRESSEDKSESISSYVEGTSSSSEGNSLNKQPSDIVEIINSALQNSSKNFMDPLDDFPKKPELSPKLKINYEEQDNDKLIEAISPTIPKHKNASVENMSSAKYPSSPLSNIVFPNDFDKPASPVRDIDVKKPSPIKPEVKPRMTPPEPPPRKCFKPPPLKILPLIIDPRDQPKPQVPERPSVRRDLKKPEVPPREMKFEPHMSEEPKIEQRRKSDRFETYSDFVEKSTDFIDEPVTPLSSSSQTPLVDPYGYTQIPEDKNDTHSDKSNAPSTSSLIDQLKLDVFPQNQDSMDGCLPRRAQSPDSKNKTLEKDKGVVNRAMMVARSIGLHGNQGKTCNSPRGTRKRNNILTKRRNVAVKDISPGELEGWLTYRSRGAGGAWARAWFVLRGASFYRFKAHDSPKADCLITLTGCTASQAMEVKSRKYAFKVYHTGVVFYFAADTDDSLVIWLDAINKATLGADRGSTLFSETDESETEVKAKSKNIESKPLLEKTFGSLKKTCKKDIIAIKDHEMSGASLDRKYLKFLGSRTPNVPVPTAQFRSYRRVLPNTPMAPVRKPEKMSSPDLQVTIAGSTFYGLNASHSVNDVLTSSQDMGDYRRTTDRTRVVRNQRPDELQGFMTLEEFMLARQEEECQRTNIGSTHFTPLNNDHVQIQNAYIDSLEAQSRFSNNNGMIYGSPKNVEDLLSSPHRHHGHMQNSSTEASEVSHFRHGSREKIKLHKKPWDSNCFHSKKMSNSSFDGQITHFPNSPISRDEARKRLDPSNLSADFQRSDRKLLRNEGHSGSSGDLANHTSSDVFHRPRKDSPLSRNGSFNLSERRKRNHVFPEKNWIESLRAADKKGLDAEKNRLKNVAQYQPPPMPTTPFEQDGMRPTFEMHLDRESKKGTKLKNFFSNKSLAKPNCYDFQPEPQKTLLGSPRLHRAIFRDKTQRQNQRSGSQSSADSTTSQNFQSQSINTTVSSFNTSTEWNTEPSTYSPQRVNDRRQMSPPQLPYIPPPTSPPPDYPGLDYPPVFEPGTYSLSDASILRNRGKENHNNSTDL